MELLAGNEQPEELPECARVLIICDTGCATSMGNDIKQFEPGSAYEKASTVLGVGGNMVTKQRAHLRMPLAPD